jgi:hypothetical protein
MVAHAAPAIPHLNTTIKIGSKIIFIPAPMSCVLFANNFSHKEKLLHLPSEHNNNLIQKDERYTKTRKQAKEE